MKNFLVIITLLIGFGSCSSTAERESTSEYLDNMAISTKIKTKLVGKTGLDATGIDVESYKGVVILSGFVDSEKTKKKALTLAENTKNVREVKDALYVKAEITK